VATQLVEQQEREQPRGGERRFGIREERGEKVRRNGDVQRDGEESRAVDGLS
jgi:hypothetical protein